MLLATLLTTAQAQDPTLYRVDIPDYPNALISSNHGSLLDHPPDDVNYRPEPLPEPQEETGQSTAWEALDAMNIEAWHEAGYLGQGVKLAVFDVQWTNAELQEDELGEYETHDCYVHAGCTPAMDTLRPRFTYETGSHGVACAEIVRDVAPEVELHLVRVNGLTTFENAADWAVREDIDVVTLSMSFLNDSFYDGTGASAQIVEGMARGGVLLTTSSGNYADGHWREDFHDTDADDFHDFPWGSPYLPVYFEPGKERSLSLTWDDFLSCGDTDLDAYLINSEGEIIGRGEKVQEPGSRSCVPVERVSGSVDEGQWVWLMVKRAAGDPATRWNLIATSSDVYHSMPEGSATDPGTHPLAFTVGAARALGYGEDGPEDFSSWGPNASGDLMPDIVAPDGVTTLAYGAGSFYGTSAASPAAAAAVALAMSRFPEMDGYEAADWLKSRAVDDRTTWQQPNLALGAGYLVLPDPTASSGCVAPGGWQGAWIVLPLACLRRRRGSV